MGSGLIEGKKSPRSSPEIRWVLANAEGYEIVAAQRKFRSWATHRRSRCRSPVLSLAPRSGGGLPSQKGICLGVCVRTAEPQARPRLQYASASVKRLAHCVGGQGYIGLGFGTAASFIVCWDCGLVGADDCAKASRQKSPGTSEGLDSATRVADPSFAAGALFCCAGAGCGLPTGRGRSPGCARLGIASLRICSCRCVQATVRFIRSSTHLPSDTRSTLGHARLERSNHQRSVARSSPRSSGTGTDRW